MLAFCRARQAEDGQNADDSLYFMVLDVIEEPGGRFNIMGKTEGEQSILVQVHDFEPYFYIGQPVFKAGLQAHALPEIPVASRCSTLGCAAEAIATFACAEGTTPTEARPLLLHKA